ncbi:hypothetical protein ACQ86N_17855 [Puia sp. P3]|uniref:hypothetical protein n=1 Tax=Puia sp. P3 TaxID=3423952 RepID=UPI003D6651A5
MAIQHNPIVSRYAAVYVAILGLLSLLIAGCQKEAALTPSPAKPLYTLPQGNHSYDQTIMQFYQTYHSLMLYRFDSVAYNYNVTGPLNPDLTMTMADTNAISSALDFLHANWLDLYPSAFCSRPCRTRYCCRRRSASRISFSGRSGIIPICRRSAA